MVFYLVFRIVKSRVQQRIECYEVEWKNLKLGETCPVSFVTIESREVLPGFETNCLEKNCFTKCNLVEIDEWKWWKTRRGKSFSYEFNLNTLSRLKIYYIRKIMKGFHRLLHSSPHFLHQSFPTSNSWQHFTFLQ